MREIRPSGSEGGAVLAPVPTSIGGPGMLPGASITNLKCERTAAGPGQAFLRLKDSAGSRRIKAT